MFFDTLHDLIRVAVVSTLAYAWLVLVLRVAGKRALSKLNAFDLVVTVALGSTLASVLLTKDVALLEGALAFCMLAVLQRAVSRVSVYWPGFGRLVRSEPRMLVENGRILGRAMIQERITQPELEAVIRKAGFGRIEDVAVVVLETDGDMSVIGRGETQLTVLGSVSR
ncbi:DUF421 domain-containing protein [Caulobacter sp. CCH9-E1]|uniref:DUF421 domain-containing protein n=1 Tax=Caulobacter sp. CCH9-E1 TaxID=1768768 RepID=UPI00082E4296|nr:YetF domain-containing protein [Caulobacter sp. CCH9-E1]